MSLDKILEIETKLTYHREQVRKLEAQLLNLYAEYSKQQTGPRPDYPRTDNQAHRS